MGGTAGEAVTNPLLQGPGAEWFRVEGEESQGMRKDPVTVRPTSKGLILRGGMERKGSMELRSKLFRA